MTLRRSRCSIWLAIILAHLALGAALTVLGAWLVAALPALQPAIYQQPFGNWNGWSVNEYRGVATVLRSAHVFDDPRFDRMIDAQPWIERAVRGDEGVTSVNEEVRGWPWPCVSFRTIGRGPVVFDGDHELRGGVPIEPMPDSMSRVGGMQGHFELHRALPCTIEPRAFAATVLAWTGGLALLTALAVAFRAMRHRHRTRCGRCVSCGYDLRETNQPLCSECGFARGERPSLASKRFALLPLSGAALALSAMVLLAVWKSAGRPRLDLLHAAARDGDVEAVTDLLAAGADVNAPCHDGPWDYTDLTPLMWAARRGRSDVIQRLIDAGADVQAVDSKRQTALHWAAWRGDVDSIQLLLAAGADLEAISGDDLSPLACAIMQGAPRRQAAIALLDAGADVHRKVGGVSLLYWTGARPPGDLDLLRILLDRAPELLEDEKDVRLIVLWMIKYRRLAELRELADRGCDIATIAAEFTSAAAAAGDLELVQYLAELGVPITQSPYGDILHMAFTTGNVEMARYMLAQGLDPTARNSRGETILFWGVWASTPEMADLALSLGVDVNATADDGSTALMSSAGNGITEAVRRLLAAGADPKAQDNAGMNALGYVKRRETAYPYDPRLEIIRMLEEAMADAPRK
ncbi:MAG: ankyrin repeat domain-containing protein [Phycisphaerales bacterium]|nr:ankyrin repeat domain-containing protein [Phycisphaerales bacterium]